MLPIFSFLILYYPLQSIVCHTKKKKKKKKVLTRPLQALLWEVTIGNTQSYVETLRTWTVVQGLSRMLGYAVVGIWLEWDIFGDRLSNIIWIFTIGSVIVLLSACICLSLSPNPSEIAYYYEDIPTLETLTHTHEASKKYATGITFLKSIDDDPDQYSDAEIKNLLLKKDAVGSHLTQTPEDEELVDVAPPSHTNESEYQEIGLDDITPVREHSQAEAEEEEPQDEFYKDYMNSSSLTAVYLLWASHIFGWITMCSVVLFWTSFCAIDVYNGGPKADTNSDSFHDFESGLTFGVFGLLLMALVQINASLLFDSLHSISNTRSLFLVGQFCLHFIG
ncbi:hypothetical protein RFI_10557 [Reticulomyxa filosa]|uniref:Uncharacterized protein n=1 Tax=Reticulomyxa filosa TaxID=46433 RepID=X6NMF1_RETFI|nr:hypothetical protein RFI_10557 [Reticulomyxa filosa]|eukprot:ETO26577.1 hypothetical protein RFI_10557 [Reticulomyxa filosa]